MSRTQRRGSVLGLDLSLTRSAFVLLPADWEGDWREVSAMTSGSSLSKDASELERHRRIASIGHELDRFLAGATLAGAFVEGYSFGNAQRAHQLGELRGVIRGQLVSRFALAPQPIAPTSVRKLFFGAVPKERGDALKRLLLATVQACGAPFKLHDEADAFLVANYGLTECGGRALTLQGEAAQASPSSRASGKSKPRARGV